jgi:hypothetical protein
VSTARIICLLFIAVAAAVPSLATPQRASAEDPPPYRPLVHQQLRAAIPRAKHPKFASSIAQLVEAAQRIPIGAPLTPTSITDAQPALGGFLASGLLRLDEQGRVQVYIHVSATSPGIAGEMEALGAVVEIQSEAGDTVQARVPIRALPRIAALGYVKSVTPPNYGHVNVGSRLTEGDALLDFNDVRTNFGVDGSGVTIGVISDGIYGLQDAINSADLPVTNFNRVGGKLTSTTDGVIAQSFRSDRDLEAGLSPGTRGAEGTAMLEIVHDIAPGAQLRFANFATSLEFNAAVDFLAANSDVVVDDITWFTPPYDQTSTISTNTATELNKPENRIRGYYTSVANQALNHYQEDYVAWTEFDCGDDGTKCHRFSATTNTTNAFNLSPRPSNPILVNNGRTAVVFFSWDDTFGNTTTDYDLCVFRNDTGQLVDCSATDNTQTDEPTEFLPFTNNTGANRFYDIVIFNFNGASPPRTLELFVLGTATLPNGTRLNFNTLRSSVPAQSDAGGGVVSVGAIDAADPGNNEIEPFSSRGPTNNNVTKPDVAAIDGVQVTGSGGFPSTFFGTSAAAPHVAALAGLLLDLRDDLKRDGPGDNHAAERDTLRAAIVDTAVELGAPGVDNTFGSGRINGLNSAKALVCGDQTGDGRFGIADVIVDLQIVVGALTPTRLQRIRADLDFDGRTDVADAVVGLQRIVGITPVPGGC